MPPKDPASLPKPPESESPSPSGSRSWWQSQRENLLTLLLALLLALGIRTFVAEARWIPSDSMLPTLVEGDRLVVEKISYRFGSPQRGDIIVFNPPAKLNFDGAYIKRVIGLPGERMRIANGKVFINSIPLQEDYIYEPPNYSCPGERCPGVRVWGSESDFVVPPGSYFVMGDNRNDSQDSHVWGFLPEENIIGNTIFRFWPPNRLHFFVTQKYPELSPEAQVMQPFVEQKARSSH
ncbi:MAG: signal peptidase I [Thermostichus sp. DG_1_6_bins_120]